VESNVSNYCYIVFLDTEMLNRKGLTVYLEVAKHCFHALFTCRSTLPFSIVTPPADRIDSR